jgi:hypothetical protein
MDEVFSTHRKNYVTLTGRLHLLRNGQDCQDFGKQRFAHGTWVMTTVLLSDKCARQVARMMGDAADKDSE